MRRAFACLVAACAALGLAGTAGASPSKTFEVEFWYTVSDPPEEIYREFKETARMACARQMRGSGTLPISARAKSMQTCKKELLGKAVAGLGSSTVLALHDDVRAFR